MHFLIFLCTIGASVLAVENAFYSAGNGTFLASNDFRDHSPTRAILPASHVLRGLITRQGCSVGYAQCTGYSACCPAGGGCCIRSSDAYLVACCGTGEVCANTATGALICCVPGPNCTPDDSTPPPPPPATAPSSPPAAKPPSGSSPLTTATPPPQKQSNSARSRSQCTASYLFLLTTTAYVILTHLCE